MDSISIQLPPRPDQPRYEQPPNAPYDPPQPAPQAAAWRRALKVVNDVAPTGGFGTRVGVTSESVTVTREGRLAKASMRHGP